MIQIYDKCIHVNMWIPRVWLGSFLTVVCSLCTAQYKGNSTCTVPCVLCWAEYNLVWNGTATLPSVHYNAALNIKYKFINIYRLEGQGSIEPRLLVGGQLAKYCIRFTVHWNTQVQTEIQIHKRTTCIHCRGSQGSMVYWQLTTYCNILH